MKTKWSDLKSLIFVSALYISIGIWIQFVFIIIYSELKIRFVAMSAEAR